MNSHFLHLLVLALAAASTVPLVEAGTGSWPAPSGADRLKQIANTLPPCIRRWFVSPRPLWQTVEEDPLSEGERAHIADITLRYQSRPAVNAASPEFNIHPHQLLHYVTDELMDRHLSELREAMSEWRKLVCQLDYDSCPADVGLGVSRRDLVSFASNLIPKLHLIRLICKIDSSNHILRFYTRELIPVPSSEAFLSGAKEATRVALQTVESYNRMLSEANEMALHRARALTHRSLGDVRQPHRPGMVLPNEIVGKVAQYI